LTTQKLGSAVQDEIGTELERVLVDRCCKRIIDRDDRANSMGSGGEACDIYDLDGWIRRRFEVQQLAALRHL
jgi:hypothetical protein